MDILPLGSVWKKQVLNLDKKDFPANANNRRFQKQWLDKYKWLEYSLSSDAAFCFACRQFGTDANSEFTKTGYNNWKNALTSSKGFGGHECSTQHIENMAKWVEHDTRLQMSKGIGDLLSDKTVLAQRKYYMKSLIGLIKLIAGNELCFRGSWDDEEHKESGLFTTLFEYSVEKDTKLKECLTCMPKNATYKSPKIQNELIEIMATMTREKIINEINSAEYCTLFVDGTKDKKGNEIISIALRYVKNGKPFETLVAFVKCDDLKAEPMADLIVDTLLSIGLDVKKILSQCYDGANVMSGEQGGIQRFLQNKLNRLIPYVHCFNHRLHLVVIAAIDEVNVVSLFFGEIKMLYNFFSRHKVKQLYDGTSISKLIDTRWSGHKRAVDSVYKNYGEILEALKKVKLRTSHNFDGEDVAIATGITNAIQKIDFIFLLCFMKKLLDMIEPANLVLQKKEMGYSNALPVINTVIEETVKLKTDKEFDEIEKEVNEFRKKFGLTCVANTRPQRTLQTSVRLSEYSVTETLGHRNKEATKMAYFDVLTIIKNEMDKRFTENSAILIALSGCSDMNLESMSALSSIIDLPKESELKVAKSFVDKKQKEDDWKGKSILQILVPVKEAFPNVYKFFCAVETFGCSTSICESSFSCLSRIDIVKRMSMETPRLLNLAFLGYEKPSLNELNDEAILNKFKEKTRRIAL